MDKTLRYRAPTDKLFLTTTNPETLFNTKVCSDVKMCFSKIDHTLVRNTHQIHTNVRWFAEVIIFGFVRSEDIIYCRLEGGELFYGSDRNRNCTLYIYYVPKVLLVDENETVMVFSRSKSFVCIFFFFLLVGQLTDHNELLSVEKRQPPGKHVKVYGMDVSNDLQHNDDHSNIIMVNPRKDLFWKTYKFQTRSIY